MYNNGSPLLGVHLHLATLSKQQQIISLQEKDRENIINGKFAQFQDIQINLPPVPGVTWKM